MDTIKKERCRLCRMNEGHIVSVTNGTYFTGFNAVHSYSGTCILNSQVVSLPLQFVIQKVANFCATMDTLIDQDGVLVVSSQTATLCLVICI